KESINLGLRTEPNLELLTQLRPSLILYSEGYGVSQEKLKRIAPCMGIRFTDGKNPLLCVRQSLLQLAEKLNLESVAHHHLEDFESEIAKVKQNLKGYDRRPLLLMSLIDSRHALLIGKNSLF